jgi:hypothetical protein
VRLGLGAWGEWLTTSPMQWVGVCVSVCRCVGALSSSILLRVATVVSVIHPSSR